jgi:hypothetical protein
LRHPLCDRKPHRFQQKQKSPSYFKSG